jgi:hypothetical protein
MALINPLYDYSRCKRVELNGTRLYEHDAGHRAHSVTSILSKTKDPSGLHAWRNRVGHDVAAQITKESASLGTTMHAHLEAHVKGDPRPGGTNVGRKLAENMANVIILNGLCDVDEVWGLEAPLIYDSMWAGTTDLVGVYKGKPAIMDFKTTRKPKKLAHVDEYRLQTVAYASSHNHMFGTNIKTCVIFMCSQNLEYQQFVWDADEYDKNFVDWLHRVYAFHA